jgi:hypothetical protein
MSHAANEAAQSSVTYWDPTIGYYTLMDPAATSSVATQVASAHAGAFLAQKGAEWNVERGVGNTLGHNEKYAS